MQSFDENTMRFDQIRKPLLLTCLAASIVLHIGVFWYLFYSKEDPLLSWEEKAPPSYQNISFEFEERENTDDDFLAQAEPLRKCMEYGLGQALQIHAPEPIKKVRRNPQPRRRGPSRKTLCNLPLQSSPIIPYNLSEEPIQFVSRNFLHFLPKPNHDFSPLGFRVEEQPKTGEHPVETSTNLELLESLLQVDLPPPILSAESQEEERDLPEYANLPTRIDLPFTPSLLAPAPLPKIQTPIDLEIGIPPSVLFTVNDLIDPCLAIPQPIDCTLNEEREECDCTLPNADYYGLSSTLPFDEEWEEEIDADLCYMPHPDKDGYIFSVTLHPHSNIGPQTLPQHFYFVINYSGSIEKQKFTRYKRAVQRALSALNERDTFNIFLFDKLITRFSEQNLPVYPKTLQKAQDFLEKQGKPSNIIGDSAYLSIDKILPSGINPDEVHSVIFISDGQTLINNLSEKKSLIDWLKNNSGTFNFYCATSGKDNDLSLLELLSHRTAGKSLYSDTNAGFPRKLVQFVKELHHPILKDITAVAIPHNNEARISLANGTAPLPPIFANSPYTLVGITDELEDFQLFIQGKCGDQVLSIRKNISFKKAAQGGHLLSKLWADAQAAICYERFLESGKNAYLREARELLISQEN